MIPQSRIPRYLAMLRMFGRHYWQRMTGGAYPAKIDAVPALLTVYEKQVLFHLAGQAPQHGQMVEIGSFKGGSTVCLCAGAPKATLHCIDTFMTENVSGSRGEDTLAIFQHNTAEYASQIVIHRGFSYDVHGEIPPQIDLLFVDGDHSYEGVLTDLRLYAPKLKDGGILIMHDSAHPPILDVIHRFILPIETQSLARLPNLYAGRIRASAVDFSAVD